MSIHVLYRYSRCLSSQKYRNPHPRQSNGGRFPLGLKSQWSSACIINFCMHTVMPVRQSEGALVSREWRGDTHPQGCLAQRSTLRPPDIPSGFHSHKFRECLSMRRLFGALQKIVNVVGLQLFNDSMKQKPLVSLIKLKIFLVLNWTWSSINVYWIIGSAIWIQPTTLHHT